MKLNKIGPTKSLIVTIIIEKQLGKFDPKVLNICIYEQDINATK